MLRLPLSSPGIPCRVIIHKPNSLLIPTVDESYLRGVSLDGCIDSTAGIPKLSIESILHQQKLSHNEDLNEPTHEVQGKSDHTVRQKGKLDLALPLIHVKLVVSDHIAIGIDRAGWKLDLDKLEDSISEEEDNRRIVEVIDESKRADADV